MDILFQLSPFLEDFDFEDFPRIGLSHLNVSLHDELSYLPAHFPLQLKSSESLSLPQSAVSHPPYDSQSPPDAGIHRFGPKRDFNVLALDALVFALPLLPQPSFFQAIGD